MHRVLLLAALAAAQVCGQDAQAIVRTSVERDQSSARRAPDYTWDLTRIERRFSASGQLTTEKVSKSETVVLQGQRFTKHLTRDGKPLPAAELKKQQDAIDKQVARLKQETPERKARRLAEDDRNRAKGREFLREMPDLYEWKLLREETMAGRPAWVLAATPRPGYQPKRPDAKNLLKFKGTLWIDKADYHWIKAEAEAIAPITWGFFIARMDAGTRVFFEQTRVNGEVWLPSHVRARGQGRLLGKKIIGEEETVWSNFRKFQVESTLLPAGAEN